MKNIIIDEVSQGLKPGRMAKSIAGRRGLHAIMAGLFVGAGLAQGNPTGGIVAAGSATISGTGTPTLTITQGSKTAIIDWNSFSIGAGETTTFLQPSATSAVLNRVTGGSTSIIDGNLNANGQVYLINGNGIVVGPGGVVNTSAFTASTLDISNLDFEKGIYNFSGSSAASVQNLGTITATTGNLFLIGQSIDNEGSLTAAKGTVGLAAAQSVLISQTGTQHVFVSATPGASIAAGTIGVNNKGTIAAAAAELRAANGNMYALAINNGGTVRATTVANQGGHIYLTSDGGIIQNTGTVDASATAAGATGGTIQLKTVSTGTIVNHGSVISHGGQGGVGGTVDLSGGSLVFNGGVDLTTPGGKTGSLLLDPQSITVVSDPNANGVVSTTGSITVYEPAPNYTGSTLDVATLQAQLGIANVVIDGVANVTVATAIAWGDTVSSAQGTETANSLTLETTGKGGTINIDASITGKETVITGTATGTGTSTLPKATLIINDEGNGYVTTGANGSIDVDNFILEAGIWQQILTTTAPTAAQLKITPGLMNTGTLPDFAVSNDFQLDNTSTFERFAGGNGLATNVKVPANSPYIIDDIFGLQGIGSPSDTLLGKDYVLGGDISGDTEEWNGGNGTNGGAGWVPIGEGGKTVKPFTGILDGAGFTVSGIYIYRPSDDLTALFGETSGTIENLGISEIYSATQGVGIGGGLVGEVMSHGLVNNCASEFGVDTTVTDPSTGTTANQSDLPLSGTTSTTALGGLVGEVAAGGTVENSLSEVGFTLLGDSGVSGLTGIGGIVGINDGTVTNCVSEADSSTTNSIQALAGTRISVEEDSINIGGLVGLNNGTINGGESGGVIDPVDDSTSSTEASIISGNGNFNIGGFVGANYGTIDSSVKVDGSRTAVTYQAFTDTSIVVDSGTVTGPDVYGGTGSYYVGGFVGVNYGKIANGYAAPNISGSEVDGDGGGEIDNSNGTTTIAGGQIYVANNLQPPGAGGTGAIGDIAVGGFAGGNFGTITKSGTEDVVTSNANVKGIGTVNVTTRTGTTTTTTTEPAPVNFASPLSMDSVFVGGFVGLNGSRSTITGCFSDYNPALAIQLTLDPTQNTPVLAGVGDDFTLQGTGNSAQVNSGGNITGGNGYEIAGGFVGGNYGSITTSYEAADVTVNGTTTQSNSFYTGGFAGVSSGSIANAYELGNVESATTAGASAGDNTGVVGGFVGQMNAGSVTYVYELGSVTGGTTREGLVGVRAAGAFSHSFWDMENNNALLSTSEDPGALGLTTAQLSVDTTTEPTSVYHTAAWNFKTIWLAPTPANNAPPTLIGVP